MNVAKDVADETSDLQVAAAVQVVAVQEVAVQAAGAAVDRGTVESTWTLWYRSTILAWHFAIASWQFPSFEPTICSTSAKLLKRHWTGRKSDPLLFGKPK